MPSVHPLHRAANLTDHTRSCRSRTRTYTSPTRRALLGVASWSASARAHRFRQPGDAVLAWPASRTAAEARAVISPSAIINLPIPGPTYTRTTRARSARLTGWLADHVCALDGSRRRHRSARRTNRPAPPSPALSLRWAHPTHSCTRTGLIPAASVRGLETERPPPPPALSLTCESAARSASPPMAPPRRRLV